MNPEPFHGPHYSALYGKDIGTSFSMRAMVREAQELRVVRHKECEFVTSLGESTFSHLLKRLYPRIEAFLPEDVLFHLLVSPKFLALGQA